MHLQLEISLVYTDPLHMLDRYCTAVATILQLYITVHYTHGALYYCNDNCGLQHLTIIVSVIISNDSYKNHEISVMILIIM